MRTLRSVFLALSFFLLFQPLNAQQSANTVDNQVSELIEKMSVYEKIGQMTQLNITMINTTGQQRDVVLDPDKAIDLIRNHHIGSFLNGEAVPADVWFTYMDQLTRIAMEESAHGIPIIYGIDHMHGASYLAGSTIFPQNINLGATFNTEHSYQTGWVTAYETADLGHHWNFAPVQDLGVNPLWPRIWETYGEDPYLGSKMGRAYVEGYQENEDIYPYKLAATAKHFFAYSNPQSGWDRTPVQIGYQALHEFHRPPFQAVVDAGIKTVMLNSGEINGIPVHASQEFVTDFLRNEMGFDGVIVTDWDDIGKLVDFHNVAENYKEAVYLAVKAGIDINMTPLSLDFNTSLLELVEEGRISVERIDESVRRILKLKFDLGLFDNPFPRNDRLDRIGTEESRLKALSAAEESIVLLKNENQVLPANDVQEIILFGPSANSKRNLNGGWTLAWQGGEEEQYPDDMHTIYTALLEQYPNASIELMEHISIEDTDAQEFISRLDRTDLLIYAGGEEPYTEFIGNITDLRLHQNQIDEINYLSQSSTELVFIMVAGRPRIITDLIQNVDAFLFAGLPGFEGAEAIVNVLSGKTNPSGRLPITYPQHTGHFVTYNHKPSDVYFFNPDEANHIAQGSESTALFQFGDGLSYTTFEYSDLTLSANQINTSETLKASVEITNTGDVAGLHSALWFITNRVGTFTRPVKELKHFEKVYLNPGESKTLTFEIDPHASLSYPDQKGEPLLESGDFVVRIDSLSSTFRLNK